MGGKFMIHRGEGRGIDALSADQAMVQAMDEGLATHIQAFHASEYLQARAMRAYALKHLFPHQRGTFLAEMKVSAREGSYQQLYETAVAEGNEQSAAHYKQWTIIYPESPPPKPGAVLQDEDIRVSA